MPKLSHAKVEHIRGKRGQSLLLFITDRCPVGCAHCSVDSRPDSPSITDFSLFESVLTGICSLPGLMLVGISGGEPFVERRGLTLAVDRLSSAGLAIGLYTSGVWARNDPPEWVYPVISKVSCVYLSTDAFHEESINAEQFVKAARVIANEGTWLIVQVLDLPEMVERAKTLLERAFGSKFGGRADLNLIPPLPYGRANSLFATKRIWQGQTFGTCRAVKSPVVRYDGTITACCNEQVIMGLGPDRLRTRCADAEEVREALTMFSKDPMLQVIGGVGVGALTYLPEFSDLAKKSFPSICTLCWALQDRVLPLGDRLDNMMKAMSLTAQEVNDAAN